MSPPKASLPVCRDWLVQGFLRYAQPMMAKHFHALAVNERLLPEEIPENAPIIVYGNHPGWWDPIVAALLRREYFPLRRMYAPIDAQALAQYKILSQMGFYGLELDSKQGAADFLRVSRAILSSPKSTLWLTPEGQFSDPRDRSTSLMTGLAHLVHRQPGIWVLPLAVEYCFWEERLPEALAMFGAPMDSTEFSHHSKSSIHQKLTEALRTTQDGLSQLSIARDSDSFRVIFSGKRRTWYDIFRFWRSFLGGKSFRADHGEKLNRVGRRGDR